MSYALSQENQLKLQSLFKKYPQKKALTLPLLWIIQYQDGYISTEAMAFASKVLEVSVEHIYGVITFYTMFRLTPPKKYTIEVCHTLSCELCGAQEIIEQIKSANRDDIELIEVECLGACGYAPMCAINGLYHENLSAQKMQQLLESLK